MHPDLRQTLAKTISRGSSAVRWSVPLILHRLRRVIAVFLRYHGWRADGLLQVYPRLARWEDEGRSIFDIVVRIEPQVMMEAGDEVPPGEGDVYLAEQALSWTILALFDHAEELQLPRSLFW
ncbi:MAG: hypothetical protein KKA73_06480 [Chloroflexi bacterium]|nr:hypothetical protein [Chloroflexota bacterium]MBU1747317.1 hypothetical protein [Chloroflexota bacterium]